MLSDKAVHSVDIAADDSVWLAVSDGLYHFDGYQWIRYTTEHGLPSNYVRCVLITTDGTIWVGTDNGAGVFNGSSFDRCGTKNRLAGPSVRRIVEDPDGSLWFCCDQWPIGNLSGGLTRMQDGQFKTWRKEDGLPSNYISDYFRDSTGQQFVLTNKGLAQFTSGTFREPLKEAELWDVDTYVWSIVESEQHGLIAATDTHFFQFLEGKWRRIPNTIKMLSQPKLVAAKNGEVYTCTSWRGMEIYRWELDNFVPASRKLADAGGGVEMLVEDSAGAIWIAGFERLYRWERHDAEWTIVSESGEPIFEDRQGGIWLEARNQRVKRYHDGNWTTLRNVASPIIEDRSGDVWLSRSNGLGMLKNDDLRGHVTDLVDKIETVRVPGVHNPVIVGNDGRGVVWVWGTSADGKLSISGFDDNQWSSQLLAEAPSSRTVCFAITDPNSGVWVVLGTNRLPPFQLLHITPTGVAETPLPEIAQISNPPRILIADSDTVMICGFFGVHQWSAVTQSWAAVSSPSPAVMDAKALNGELWFSCRGHLGGRAGLLRYHDGEWISFVEQQGAFAGGNDTTSLVVADHGCLHTIHSGLDAHAPPLATPFLSRATNVLIDSAGEYWVGVRNRTYRYVPDQSPPQTVVTAHDSQLSMGEDQLLSVAGIERFKPTLPARHYQVSLRVNESDWSTFKPLDGKIRIPNLALGSHTVHVRVRNSAGQIDDSPAAIRFQVLPVPLQSKAWFKPAVVISFMSVLALAVFATMNWRQVRRQAFSLENEVAKKTARLSSSEQRYRMLFEDSQDAICLFGPDGLLQTCNEAARDLFGPSSEQNISVKNLFSDSRDLIRFQNVMNRDGKLRGTHFRMKKLNDDVFEAILSANCHIDKVGSKIGYQVIIRDISDLVKLQKRSSESEKMEAIGRMAGGIAHDFNNFLAVVMYGADLIKMASKEQGPDSEVGMKMILEAAESCKNLTSKIQTFCRAPSFDLSVIDANSAMSAIPTILQGVVPDSVQLEVDLAERLGYIYADPHQLQQVVLNLAVNACHAMPDGGRLSITACNVMIDEDSAIQLRLNQSGPHVQLNVTDTGLGMDASTCDRIFEPFFTTKPHGRGSGLGLAIVYGIMQQFRGQIQVHSVPGKGTRFEMLFPVCYESRNGTDENIHAPKAVHGTETILLVEDEEHLRNLTQRSLMTYGYKVHVSQNATKAQTFIESGAPFDMVISDVVMPGISGLELAQWIRATRPETAILLVSGFPQTDGGPAPNQIDVPFLKKPFRPIELAARIREVLDSRVDTSPSATAAT